MSLDANCLQQKHMILKLPFAVINAPKEIPILSIMSSTEFGLISA